MTLKRDGYKLETARGNKLVLFGEQLMWVKDK